jgi:hypothetical protein
LSTMKEPERAPILRDFVNTWAKLRWERIHILGRDAVHKVQCQPLFLRDSGLPKEDRQKIRDESIPAELSKHTCSRPRLGLVVLGKEGTHR